MSDVYQDLFQEGSYTGKGIYEIDAFEAAFNSEAYTTFMDEQGIIPAFAKLDEAEAYFDDLVVDRCGQQPERGDRGSQVVRDGGEQLAAQIGQGADTVGRLT